MEKRILAHTLKQMTVMWLGVAIVFFPESFGNSEMKPKMVDKHDTVERLKEHLRVLTVAIGERSVKYPDNLDKARTYIEAFYRQIGLPVHSDSWKYEDITVANVEAEISLSSHPAKRYLIGAHYDSVAGTVGADDNASAVAVQLETARQLSLLKNQKLLDIAVKFVSFTLEEPPGFGTSNMGSRVYAKKARNTNEIIDGMICLEMVGYTCREPGCQDYPLPLMFTGYPEIGNYIGMVGDSGSKTFLNALFAAFQQNPALPVIKLTVPLKGWLIPSVRLSDHSSFWDQGYPAVMVTDTAFYRNPHYHLSSDTMDKLDFEFMAELVESLILFLCSEASV